jgi:hypothetical protein
MKPRTLGGGGGGAELDSIGPSIGRKISKAADACEAPAVSVRASTKSAIAVVILRFMGNLLF